MAQSKESRIPDSPIRIGIVAIWQSREPNKSEVVSMTRKVGPEPAGKGKPKKILRPWLVGINKTWIIKRDKADDVKGPKIAGVATDVAVGAYIEWAYSDKNVFVDLIKPGDVSKERLARNHLNFHILYDDLEGFHGDRSTNKRVWRRICEALDGADNLFPPRYYQKLINNKISYYNYCKEHDINICPTFTMDKGEYTAMLADKGTVEAVADHFWHKIQKLDWFRFFCKPVYGVESKDAKMFTMTPKDKEDASERTKFQKYFKHILTKYPGIVIQKYIIGFGANTYSPECRCVFVGDEYQMAMIQTDDIQYRPQDETFWFTAKPFADFPIKEVRDFAVQVRDKLPKMEVQGVPLPRFTTRVDIGVGQHPPGLPDLRCGATIRIKSDAEEVFRLCKAHKMPSWDKDNQFMPLKLKEVVAGAEGVIERIKGGDYTVYVRYTDPELRKEQCRCFPFPNELETTCYPIQAIEGFDEKAMAEGRIETFVNEIEYCPSLFVEETTHLIDKSLGDQMVNITRLFVEGRRKLQDRPKKRQKISHQPLAEIAEMNLSRENSAPAATKAPKRTDPVWIKAVAKARKSLGVSGFCDAKKGTPLYNQAREYCS